MLLFDLSACSWRFSLKSLLIWICNNKGSSCGLVNVTVALSIPIGLVTVVLSIRLVWLDVLNWDLLLSKYVRSHLTGRCWHSHVWPRATATPKHLPLPETQPRASSSPPPLQFEGGRRYLTPEEWAARNSSVGSPLTRVLLSCSSVGTLIHTVSHMQPLVGVGLLVGSKCTCAWSEKLMRRIFWRRAEFRGPLITADPPGP